jgi:hypothetical protein
MTAALDPQRLMAEAAIAVADGSPDAHDVTARAIAALERAQDRGCAAADLELLERFRAQLATAAA